MTGKQLPWKDNVSRATIRARAGEEHRMSIHIGLIRTVVASILLVVFLGVALGEDDSYNSESDVYIQIENHTLEEVAAAIALGTLGTEMFELQEELHDVIGESTGEEIDHYYIWICVGDECIPIDPFEFGG